MTGSMPVLSGAGKFRWPVSGRVITDFSNSKQTGINIEAPEGAAIRAAENGQVIYVGNGVEGYGNLILIRHPNGFVSAYAHLKDTKVSKGDIVSRGDQIGKGVDAEALGDDEQFGHRRDQSDRRQILGRIVRHLFLQARADGDRAGARKADGVAIGRRLGDVIGPDDAPCAAAVIDDDRLRQRLSHAFPECPRNHVVARARREGHHEPDRLHGISRLAGCIDRPERHGQRGRNRPQGPVSRGTGPSQFSVAHFARPRSMSTVRM